MRNATGRHPEHTMKSQLFTRLADFEFSGKRALLEKNDNLSVVD
ncbi:MAG: hypothetical protein U0R49_07735 [Fimbriimonadales bacterium]